jgi:NADH-quinone oxidoreductase subunit J
VITFYVLGALILFFALLVVTARNTVHGILFLVADFLAVAMLYAAMNSMFVAAIQVLVYAGGIVVLYLFVVMLVNQKRVTGANRDPRRRNLLGGALALATLAELAALAVHQSIRPGPPSGAAPGLVEPVALALFSDYIIPFEVASVLLLVAMVGAIILARREL